MLLDLIRPIDGALQLLQAHWSATAKGAKIVVDAPQTESPVIVNHLSSHDIAVHQVIIQRQSLEDFFMSVTGYGEGMNVVWAMIIPR
jgi:hypothetical protein